MDKNEHALGVPDKRIPLSVMIIGTFEVAVALLGLILVMVVGQLDAYSVAFLILLAIYGAMGAGLWAIQEWARFANVVLHLVSVPYILFTYLFLDGPSGWHIIAQLLIAIGIVYALSRPEIRHKFQTVVPKKRKQH